MNLDDFKNKTILLFGKSRAFSSDEFNAQMKFHKITVLKEYGADVELIVDGRMMTPYEQNMSDELYETQKVKTISIDVLERALAKEIDPDTLLMSLKLSHNKERLKGFLQNTMINDLLFLKLLRMYSWQGEDFFENDDNRDVSAALIGRFYKNIERNHNVQYATTGLYHLVLQTDDEELLESIAILEPLKYHKKILKALVTHPKVSKKVLKKFLKEADEEIKEAIAYNPNLDKSIVKVLIEDKHLASIIARNIKLDDELFSTLFQNEHLLASNESIDTIMQKKLFLLNDHKIHLALAANKNLDEVILNLLLELKNDEIKTQIYKNSACKEKVLVEAYKEKNNFLALASNKATPQYILQELSKLSDEKILKHLAKNENTPIEILYQLQLDNRFDRAVKENPAFGKHIQSENIGWLV